MESRKIKQPPLGDSSNKLDNRLFGKYCDRVRAQWPTTPRTLTSPVQSSHHSHRFYLHQIHQKGNPRGYQHNSSVNLKVLVDNALHGQPHQNGSYKPNHEHGCQCSNHLSPIPSKRHPKAQQNRQFNNHRTKQVKHFFTLLIHKNKLNGN